MRKKAELIPFCQVTLVSGGRRRVYGSLVEPLNKLEWRVVARRLVIVILKEIFGVD